MTTWQRNEPIATRRTCVLDINALADGSPAPLATDFTGKLKIRLGGGIVWTAAGGTLLNSGFDGHWVYTALQTESDQSANEVELRIVDATYFAQTFVQIDQYSSTIQADAADIQARLPAALVGGKMDSTVSATVSANLVQWLGVAPAALSTSGFVQTLLRCWLTDNAGGIPNPLISGRVDAAASIGAILDELLSSHAVVGSVADGIAVAAGLLQGNFFMDQTTFTSDGDQTGARLRLFRTGTATQNATVGGSGEGEFATFVVTTEYLGPNKVKDHRVVRQ